MKRLLSLLLVFSMSSLLCACQNSSKTEDQFQSELQELTNELTFINICCDHVTGSVYKIWTNSETDRVVGLFNSALLFNDAKKTPEEYADQLPFTEHEIDVLLWGIACGLNPAVTEEKYGIKTGGFVGNGEQETIELCSELSAAYNNISDGIEHIAESCKLFKEIYSDSHAKEVELLNDWYIETSLYADFSLTPSGTMRTYAESINEYKNAINRYKKNIEVYIKG